MPNNKIIYNGNTLIDLTGDTVTKDKLLSGATAHDKSGAVIEGECAYDVDSSDATVAVAEIMNGKTAYARGAKLVGTMPDKSGTNGAIASKDDEFAIPMGFHDGSGKVSIAADEKAKLIEANIKSGIEILGVTGSYGGEEIKAQSNKDVTPAATAQQITPDEGFDYLSQVTVKAIPYAESENSAGGITVTIG